MGWCDDAQVYCYKLEQNFGCAHQFVAEKCKRRWFWKFTCSWVSERGGAFLNNVEVENISENCRYINKPKIYCFIQCNMLIFYSL